MKKGLFYIFCACVLALLLVGCYRQEKVRVAQTFCIENLTDDTWLMEEITLWNGGLSADSAKMRLAPMQSDSVTHFFTLWKGGAMTPAIVPTMTILDLYLTQGCAISTRLVNQSNGQTYEWEQELLPVAGLDKAEGVPFMWEFVEEEGTAYRAAHTFKCVIHPEN